MDSESDVALETEQLGKKYGKNRAQNWALRNCSFRLPPGRIAALVGPIGAGKSTPLTGSGSSRHRNEHLSLAGRGNGLHGCPGRDNRGSSQR
jgi:ABC-type glutathione transport system ATPase component